VTSYRSRLILYVERGWIGCDDPLKSSLAAPEFHAALEVRVENPHVILSPKALNRASFLPLAKLHAKWIRARRGRRANVIAQVFDLAIFWLSTY